MFPVKDLQQRRRLIRHFLHRPMILTKITCCLTGLSSLKHCTPARASNDVRTAISRSHVPSWKNPRWLLARDWSVDIVGGGSRTPSLKGPVFSFGKRGSVILIFLSALHNGPAPAFGAPPVVVGGVGCCSRYVILLEVFF
jgi:hypothetical protein